MSIADNATKYSTQWKLEQIKTQAATKGGLSVVSKNKTLVFKYDGDDLSVKINDNPKYYSIKNMMEVLIALAEEKDSVEINVYNPDSYSRATIYVFEMKINHTLW